MHAVDVAELKQRLRLSDLIGQSVKLQRRGREHLALCPFHNEKTPSFTVNDAKAFFYCFGCNAHGDVIDFIMRIDGITFLEARERLRVIEGLPAISPRADDETDRRRHSEQPIAEDDEAEEKRQCAQEIWRKHIPLWEPEAALGVVHLCDVRGLEPPYPETIGFGHLPYPEGPRLPALIVARHDPANGDHVRGIQRIYLQEDGQKYSQGDRGAKLSLGSIPHGRARLINPFPLERLIVGEGVETALSAHRIWSQPGCWGCWAMCGSFPKQLPMPATVAEVLLVADADSNGGSETKALALAEWMRSTGRKARVLVPKLTGSDANDLLMIWGRKP